MPCCPPANHASRVGRFSFWAALLSLLACSTSPGRVPPPERTAGIAIFYGSAPPIRPLSRYTRLVVDAHVLEPGSRAALQSAGVQLFAYVSMGEADPGRPWYDELDKGWFLGTNPGWGNSILDQRHPGWRRYLMERHVPTLRALGIRDLFLDTLDSYEIIVRDKKDRAAQEAALRGTLEALISRYPDMSLFFHRGFNLVSVPNCIGVAAESLYEGYDAAAHRYRSLATADRDWLLKRLKAVRAAGKMAVAIDYVSPDEPALAQRTAKSIATLGFVPWVSDWGLDLVGVGAADLGR